jgi:hypothetical protein
MLHYWLSVFLKAFWDTWYFINQSRTGVAFLLLVVVLTLFWLWQKHGLSDAVKHYGRTLGEGFIIAAVAWALVFAVNFLYAPFHLQNDMRARRDNVQAGLEGVRRTYDACASSLTTEQVKTSLLQANITSQQSLINSQQSMLNSQQQTLGQQQGTVNSCVVSLGKLNVPEPLKISSLSPVNIPNVSAWPKWEVSLVTTNKMIQRTAFVVSCQNNISFLDAEIAGSSFRSGAVTRLSDRSYFININSPAWTPDAPLELFWGMNDSGPWPCHYERQE